MFEHLAERQQELAFSTILLLSVGLAFGVFEGSAQLYASKLKKEDVDWSSLVSSAAEMPGNSVHPKFKPNSEFGHLKFNSRGYRSPELKPAKSANAIRIVYLGNSVVFGAEYPEDVTLPAVTTRLLAAAVPQCSFEYVTMAGPSYSMNFLADLWRSDAPGISPDLAVVLAGTVTELARAHDAVASPADHLVPREIRKNQSDWKFRSQFIALAQRQIALTSPIVAMKNEHRINWDRMSASFDRMSEDLVLALEDTPVLALSYRSMLRASQTPDEQKKASRNLRAAIPGLTVKHAVELTEFVAMELKRVAEASRWHFADAMGAVPGNREFFRDFTHLSEAGIQKLAATTAEHIAAQTTQDCRIMPKDGRLQK